MKYRLGIALLLSLAGAALDFASASLLMKSDRGLSFWPTGLFAFGALIAATGILGATSLGTKRMRVFGGLMLVYGVIMLIIGYLMYSIPMMEGATLSSLGMFLVGLSMMASGSLMSFSPFGKSGDMQSRGSVGKEVFVTSLVLVGLLGFGLGFYFESASSSGTGTMSTSTGKMAPDTTEQLTIDTFDFTNLSLLKMSVMNTGPSPLTIARVSFNGTDVTPGSFVSCIVNQVSSSDVPIAAPIGTHTECKLSFPITGAKAGSPYPVRITTSEGVQFVFSLTAGGTSISM